ncbi:unnamed protein product (macronuclear) [Paramecium tetraurelia]|uniref:Uncharacterized protein n=1 Tax=Paramecium tetraurelia TaxID=5888 RepID=A0CK11_PARTE|nr:uncharacterized protein GSPATT00000840001 [Paramecium tetraurelia]CAK71128.1 unnamed protein product [Paramecium tetraurelia]|eukprot:XP_001438525.1 hypothetical protein (macronuclear) [Paramecium tetraurelia strain d4-2]
MSSKITIYGIINHEDSDLFESAGSLTLRTPRNVPNFNETTSLTIPGYVKQICAGQSHILALTQDGNVYSYGSNQFGQRGSSGPGFQLVMKNVLQIAVGLYHSAACTKDNKIYVWGRGSEGQLGMGDTENVEKPTELSIQGQEVCCGSFHTLVRNGETCYVMGENQNGQLGVLGQHTSPVKLSIPIDQMAAGLDHSLFLYKGQVFVTGNNLFGQCGVSEQVVREPIKLSLNFEVQQVIASMGTFSCVISKQGKVYFWGTGSWGYARKCTPLEELCKLDEEQRVSQVISGENFAMLKCLDGWYVFGMNKMPENYSQQQTHRITLNKVNLVDGQISAGLNIVFVYSHNHEVQKPTQQMPVDQGSYVSQSSEQEYKQRPSYKQNNEVRQSYQMQTSSALKTSQIPPSALRQSQQVTNISQFSNQISSSTQFQQEYQSNKIESKQGKDYKLSDLLYRSDHKQDIRQDLKLDLRQSEQKVRTESRTPDNRNDQKQNDKKSDYKLPIKEDELKVELKQELLKLEKRQEQFKQEIINQQQQLDRKNENLKEITFGFKSDVKPLQERNMTQQSQKCYDCLHFSQKNDYYQKHIKFQEEEISNLKKELEILKNQIKQKDNYVNELENRILKYQETSFKQVCLQQSQQQQQPPIYKPTMEVRLKSEEKQPVTREEAQLNYQKIIDYSPKIYRQPIIDQSPKERTFNTSIIDKIQTYQQSAKAARPVHQNLMNRYSAHEVQPQQIYQPNTYVIPQYFKARN